jgi:hypothetical protein
VVRIVLTSQAGRGRDLAHSIINHAGRGCTMLWALAVVLVVLWGFGFLAFHVTSGLIHLVLLAAVVAIVFQLVAGRRAI